MIGSITDGVSAPDGDDVRRYVKLGRKRVRVGWKRLALSLARSPGVLDSERALERLSDSPRVTFLCLGNICRSPMAERYLRERLRELEVDGVTVESAGFIETEDRPSPDHAVAAASEFEVDLTDHRSTLATEELLERSDVVFLMDAYNLLLLERHFPGMVDRSFLLRAFSDGEEFEIHDPFGTEADEYRRVYEQVSDALDSFVSRVEREYR